LIAESITLLTSNTISSQKETYSVYFQDDWKVSPKLTINIGIRYDLFSPISEKFGRQANFAYWRETPTLVIPEGPNQDAPLPPNFYPQVDVTAVRLTTRSRAATDSVGVGYTWFRLAAI